MYVILVRVTTQNPRNQNSPRFIQKWKLNIDLFSKSWINNWKWWENGRKPNLVKTFLPLMDALSITKLMYNIIGCCFCAWWRTCFSDFRLGFDLANVLFLFLPFNRLALLIFLLLLRLVVPNFCHFIMWFKSLHVFFLFFCLFFQYIVLYLCLHKTTYYNSELIYNASWLD